MNLPLTEEEKAGVGITKEWQANSLQAMNLRPGPDGSVQFTYGASMPSIVCAVLEVTDLQLQTGEIINGVHVGDSVRWTVESAVSGEGATQNAHLDQPANVSFRSPLASDRLHAPGLADIPERPTSTSRGETDTEL